MTVKQPKIPNLDFNGGFLCLYLKTEMDTY